jgi:hypothetical protein
MVCTWRSYSKKFKQEAVQLLLNGHSAPLVAEWLGLSRRNVLYSWKKATVGGGWSRDSVFCGSISWYKVKIRNKAPPARRRPGIST